MYFLDPADIVRDLLHTKNMKAGMYFGLAQLVDEPKELYHSEAWA